ncbi:50S ribosomal protein L29 [Patescibacteria group bacterium]
MKDIKSKTEKDLEKELSKQREGLREFRFGVSGSKVKNTKEGKNTRKEIARIMTELNARKNA